MCVQYHAHRTDALTWHNGTIPTNEIWVKIGGDKGGGSFKMSFQVNLFISIVELELKFYYPPSNNR